jgi:hypothetical protein
MPSFTDDGREGTVPIRLTMTTFIEENTGMKSAGMFMIFISSGGEPI